MENFETIQPSPEDLMPNAAKELVLRLEELDNLTEDDVTEARGMVELLTDLQKDTENGLDQDEGVRIALTRLNAILHKHENPEEEAA